MKKEKVLYIQLLRIIACFFVIYNHTEGFHSYLTETYSHRLWYTMILSVICKVAVPIFLMIAGTLLLDKDESIKSIFTHRIIRILILLLGVSVISFVLRDSGNLKDFIYKFLSNSINGTIPYWYLYSYISFLIILPFNRLLVRNMENIHYAYLLVFKAIFLTILPIVSEILFGSQIYVGFNMVYCSSIIIFWPLMGYFFGKKYDINRVNKKKICYGALTIVVSYLITVGMTIISGQVGEYSENFLMIFDYIFAIALFVLARYVCENYKFSNIARSIITYIGDLCLGIYLLDPIFRYKILKAFDFYSFGNIGGGLMYSIVAMLVCGFVTMILKHIPYIKRML